MICANCKKYSGPYGHYDFEKHEFYCEYAEPDEILEFTESDLLTAIDVMKREGKAILYDGVTFQVLVVRDS